MRLLLIILSFVVFSLVKIDILWCQNKDEQKPTLNLYEYTYKKNVILIQNNDSFSKCSEEEVFTGMIEYGVLSGLTTGVPAYVLTKSLNKTIIVYGLGSSIGSFYYGNKKCKSSYLYTLLGTCVGTAISYWFINYPFRSMMKNFGDDDNSRDSGKEVLAPLGGICLAAIFPPAFGAFGFGFGINNEQVSQSALMNYNNQKMNFVFPQVYIAPSISNSKKVMYKVNVFSAKL